MTSSRILFKWNPVRGRTAKRGQWLAYCVFGDVLAHGERAGLTGAQRKLAHGLGFELQRSKRQFFRHDSAVHFALNMFKD